MTSASERGARADASHFVPERKSLTSDLRYPACHCPIMDGRFYERTLSPVDNGPPKGKPVGFSVISELLGLVGDLH